MKDRLTQQLQGFIRTPALWKNRDVFGLQQFEFPKYSLPENIDLQKELPDLTTNYVLGKRMERFFEFLLNYSKNIQVLKSNIQIQQEKITLGEIDFLAKDIFLDQKYHIELVYKFYVYDPSYENELERWIGPNRKDSLLQKIEKLKKQQFPILFKPETKKMLSLFGLKAEELVQSVCFKASLFIPKGIQYQHLLLLNQNCIVGFWIHFEEFTSEEYSGYNYYIPKKQDWPVHPEFTGKWFSYSEIKKEILVQHQKKKSPLVWIKKDSREYERIFIVWW
ncbi:DUF1853 family protein [Gillisia limnaea]|uniref:DUF1853 family protein n=1 Tax=Gillisia limnaea (strain DSM 15749 / LMG 21470 / R-8282) TaxID=865937 RepID=H2BQT9_GILLR|nr:DUF1853 family protein [Gillisia limnaea]EHQ04258.1 protein of unknown function DUF1853 [Gillisia limnaea DSM 15749]